jgi:magnesium transporter
VEHRLVVGADGRSLPVDGERIAKLVEEGKTFWLDLHQPDEEDIAMLRDVFGFHPLALEDSTHFGQRPKVEEYENFAFLALYGAAADDDDVAEVHCFLGHTYLITVHRDECAALAEVQRRIDLRHLAPGDPVDLLYRVVDALVDSFFPHLNQFDDAIDAMEERALTRATEDDLHEIFQLKRRLVKLRRIIGPQQNVLLAIIGGPVALSGMTPERERYFRDVYDHLIRIGELIDSHRDLLTSSLEVHLSTVSNRLNGVMKQLAVISTIFLPLTFITGFFGQNFGWLVSHVSDWPAFLGLGIGIELATLAALGLFFRRRGWI